MGLSSFTEIIQQVIQSEPAPHALYAPGTATPEPQAFQLSGFQWPQPGGDGTPITITYSYSNLLDGALSLRANQIIPAIEEALNLWATYAPLNFVEVTDSGPDPLPTDDLVPYPAAGTPNIRFGYYAIDGSGIINDRGRLINELAHGAPPFDPTDGRGGDVHFDSQESWSTNPEDGIDFLELAAHEIGHALGLNHEPQPSDGGNNAILNPLYGARYSGLGSAFLFQDDINGIRAIYGAGVGSVTSLGGQETNWDIDGNGKVDTLSDGVLALRYMFEFTGENLINGAIDTGATRTTPEEITAYLSTPRAAAMLDVDLNGKVDALSDGVLALRYMFEFTGQNLIDQALAPDALLRTPDAIESHILSFYPTDIIA